MIGYSLNYDALLSYVRKLQESNNPLLRELGNEIAQELSQLPKIVPINEVEYYKRRLEEIKQKLINKLQEIEKTYLNEEKEERNNVLSLIHLFKIYFDTPWAVSLSKIRELVRRLESSSNTALLANSNVREILQELVKDIENLNKAGDLSDFALFAPNLVRKWKRIRTGKRSYICVPEEWYIRITPFIKRSIINIIQHILHGNINYAKSILENFDKLYQYLIDETTKNIVEWLQKYYYVHLTSQDIEKIRNTIKMVLKGEGTETSLESIEPRVESIIKPINIKTLREKGILGLGITRPDLSLLWEHGGLHYIYNILRYLLALRQNIEPLGSIYISHHDFKRWFSEILRFRPVVNFETIAIRFLY